MNIVKQLENAPRNIVMYVLGLIGAVVDDYTLLTLTIFCVLLGFVLSAVLIPVTVFFGLYFLLRMVKNVSDVIGTHAQATLQAGQMEAQSTMQIAAALAQFHPPQNEGTDVDV